MDDVEFAPDPNDSPGGEQRVDFGHRPGGPGAHRQLYLRRCRRDLEGASTFRWLRGGTPIAGATAPSYALVAADEGALIRFVVTPVAQSGTSPGLAVTSDRGGTRHPRARPRLRRRRAACSFRAPPGWARCSPAAMSTPMSTVTTEGTSTFGWLRGTSPSTAPRPRATPWWRRMRER